MIRRLLPPMLVVAALIVRAPFAWACSCVQSSTMDEFRSAQAVFVGTVSTVEHAGSSNVATFAVDDVYKGAVPASARVTTEDSDAACGIQFVPGIRYTVFASSSGGALAAHLCGGTSDNIAVLPSAGITHAIPMAATPPPPHGSRAVWLILAGIFLLAATAGLVRAYGSRGGGDASIGFP